MPKAAKTRRWSRRNCGDRDISMAFLSRYCEAAFAKLCSRAQLQLGRWKVMARRVEVQLLINIDCARFATALNERLAYPGTRCGSEDYQSIVGIGFA